MSRFTIATRNAALALSMSILLAPTLVPAQGGRTGGRGGGGPQQVVPLDTGFG